MEAIERFTVSHDWITLLLVFVLGLLAITKYAFNQRFAHFVMLFATDKYFVLKGKDHKIFHPFNLLLFAVNIVTVALFIFIFYEAFYEPVSRRPKVLYLRIATAYTTFVLLKFGLEKILSNILSVDRKMDYYLFYKLSYRNFMALLLLPVCVSLIYIWEPSLTIFYICIGVILLINAATLLGIYLRNQQYILKNWFYFILYLCALEIGPYIILYKLITML